VTLPYKYVGSELEIFSRANHWKAYYGKIIRPYLVGDVLEVGAGIGATTKSLCDGTQRRWVCLEPAVTLSAQIENLLQNGFLPKCCEVITGWITTLDLEETFDAVLYIDVLEHIEDDQEELAAAATHLRPGGLLIILAPAHQWLYTPFDKQIGHYRRYTKESLSTCIPRAFECIDLRYLDSVGLFASLGNVFLLKSEMPRPWQITLWDTVMIQGSRVFDRVLKNKLGKSILGVWRKDVSTNRRAP
jgi:SAM-dependent methyltransferase